MGARSSRARAEAELCRDARPSGWSAPAVELAPSRRRCRADVGRAHAGAPRPSRRSGASSSTSRTPRRRSREHVVTVSPDVASSTNLGGWINRVGIWSVGERIDWFADDTDTLVRWRESEHGQHIELGIAEGNLVGLLGELGVTWSRDGQPLLPIGTLYDPFVNRALEPWSFGIYAGAQSILVGTPSGVTLAPEGGAHQSIITPSVGLEQPRCVAWEPAFGQDLEWTLLHALSRLGRPGGTLGLLPAHARGRSTRRWPRVPDEPAAREQRRRAGARRRLPRCAARDGAPRGDARRRGRGDAGGAARPPTSCAAAGIAVDVVCLTSPDLRVPRAAGAPGPRRRRRRDPRRAVPGRARRADRHRARRPPAHARFLAAVTPAPIACLGVHDFGQSGDVDDLYRHFGIDADTIVGAALDLEQERTNGTT